MPNDDTVKMVNCYRVPQKAKVGDLQKNQMLLTSEQASRVSKLPPGKYKKGSDLEGFKYSVVVTEENSAFAVHGGKLGQGAWGTVRLGQNVATGEWVAMKFEKEVFASKNAYEKAFQSDRHLINARNELDALRHTERAIGHMVREKKNKNLSESDTTYLAQHITVMKYSFGDTVRNVFEHLPIDEKAVSVLLNASCSIISALNEFHQKQLLHCDIKPMNIMMDRLTGEVQFIDLGMLMQGKRNEENGNIEILSTRRGTFGYLAPENVALAMQGNNQLMVITDKADIFALGMTLAKMCRLTEHRKLSQDELNNIQDERVRLDFEGVFSVLSKSDSDTYNNNFIPENIRKEIYSLLEKMVSNDPQARPTLDQCFVELNAIQLKYSPVLNTDKKIAIVSMTEYDIVSEMPLKSLKKFDEVYLLFTKARDGRDAKANKFIHGLEAGGVNIKPVIICPTKGSIDINSLALKVPGLLKSQYDQTPQFSLFTPEAVVDHEGLYSKILDENGKERNIELERDIAHCVTFLETMQKELFATQSNLESARTSYATVSTILDVQIERARNMTKRENVKELLNSSIQNSDSFYDLMHLAEKMFDIYKNKGLPINFTKAFDVAFNKATDFFNGLSRGEDNFTLIQTAYVDLYRIIRDENEKLPKILQSQQFNKTPNPIYQSSENLLKECHLDYKKNSELLEAGKSVHLTMKR